MFVFEHHSHTAYNISYKIAEFILDMLAISLALSALDYIHSFECMNLV